MLFMKGPDCREEIVEARSTHGELFKFVTNHAYMIPGTTHDRRLVVYERTNKPAPPRGSTEEDEPVRTYDGPIRDVSSDANPTIKLVRELLTGRGIRKHSQAIFAGGRTVAEVIERFPERINGWLTPPDGTPPPPELSGHVMWYRLLDPLFKEIDTSGTNSPLLLINVPDIEPWSPEAPLARRLHTLRAVSGP